MLKHIKDYKNIKHYFSKDILFIRIFFIVFFILLGIKIYEIKNYQHEYIRNITNFHPASNHATAAIAKQIPINTKVYLMAIDDVSYKAKIISVSFGVSIYFKQSDFKEDPKFDVTNGNIKKIDMVERTVKNGYVEEYMVVDADIDATYLMHTYPLDKQIIYISLTPFNDVYSNYYFKITNFTDYTNLGKSDYNLVTTGFVNQIDTRVISLENKPYTYYAARGDSYFVLNHKNFYVYVKTLQYVFLSVLTALFALLLSSRKTSPINGRVAVTGSAVFSLVASVFQINSTLRIIGAVTLFDIVTMFAGLVILLSFIITIRSLKVLDEHGFVAAKSFDQRAFTLMCIYVFLFFLGVYIYV